MFLDVTLEPRETFLGGTHRVDEILEDDLLRGMFELLRLKPPRVRRAPWPAAREDPPVAQKDCNC
jgi:hypothetical protein